MGVLSDQSKYEQAEEMHRRALGLRETILGKEDPDMTANPDFASERFRRWHLDCRWDHQKY